MAMAADEPAKSSGDVTKLGTMEVRRGQIGDFAKHAGRFGIRFQQECSRDAALIDDHQQ